jgi:hypothetical protein
MREMYDSTSPNDIPATAAIVGGYVSPSKFAWPASGWARFPNAVKVAITPSAAHYGVGVHVLDVETGDATPGQVPGWVTNSRNAGQEPTAYMSSANWTSVIQSCISAGVAMPQFWVADWDGNATLPSIVVDGVACTAVAKQYADPAHGSGGHYDLSIAADEWPGVDPGDDMSFDLTTPVPVPVLDANGNYIGDQKDNNGNVVMAPFMDFVRFADVSSWFNLTQIKTLHATLAAQAAAITALTQHGSSVTADQVNSMINDAVAQHVQASGPAHTGVAGTTQGNGSSS